MSGAKKTKERIPSRVWRLLLSAATFIVNGFPLFKFMRDPSMQHKIRFQRSPKISSFVFILLLVSCVPCVARSRDLELSRTDRPWEFFSATGTRAALFGNESGNMEAWVYPLKIFRNFHLNFLTEGRSLPAESLVRTVTVRPESSTIIYAGDTFSVKETLFVPVHESGAVITFEVETVHPLEIEAVFDRDFQLEWPAALGGT